MNSKCADQLIKKWLIKTFQIKPKKMAIYIQALTHPTYKNEHKLNYSYENLEFLGDAIIGFITSKYLFLKYQKNDEGFLTKKKIQLVQANTLSFLAKKINLNKYLFLGNGIKANDNIDKILEDSFEALIAAIYFDQGWEICYKILIALLKDFEIKKKDFTFDYKSLIQHAFMCYKGDDDLYRTKKINDNLYQATLFFNQIKYGQGFGNSKKDAQKQAAKIAYLKIALNNEYSKKNN